MAQATTHARTTTKESAGDRRRTAVARAAELSGEVLTSVESGQRSALGAVHRFVDTLDDALPAIGKHPGRRDKVIDAALDMADRLVTSQYEFLHSVLRSVERGRPAGKPSGKRTTKKAAAKAAATEATKTGTKKATAKKSTAKTGPKKSSAKGRAARTPASKRPAGQDGG